MNDNIFRWLVIGLAKQQYADNPQMQSMLVALGSMALILPLYFAGRAGGIFRRSLSQATRHCRCEVCRDSADGPWLAGDWHGSVPGIFGVLAMLGIQSALYSPARAGSIPELLHPSWSHARTVGLG